MQNKIALIVNHPNLKLSIIFSKITEDEKLKRWGDKQFYKLRIMVPTDVDESLYHNSITGFSHECERVITDDNYHCDHPKKIISELANEWYKIAPCIKDAKELLDAYSERVDNYRFVYSHKTLRDHIIITLNNKNVLVIKTLSYVDSVAHPIELHFKKVIDVDKLRNVLLDNETRLISEMLRNGYCNESINWYIDKYQYIKKLIHDREN